MDEKVKQGSGTGALREEILEDARKRAERTERAAEREAEAAVARARSRAEEIERGMTAEAEAEAAKRSRVVLASLELDRGRLELAAKQEIIGAVFDEALSRLRGMDSQDRRTAIEVLALAAAGRMKKGRLLLGVGEEDAELLDEDFLSKLGARSGGDWSFAAARRAMAGCGGVLVETEDGRESFDNTFEARRGRLYGRLRREIASQFWNTG